MTRRNRAGRAVTFDFDLACTVITDQPMFLSYCHLSQLMVYLYVCTEMFFNRQCPPESDSGDGCTTL